MRTFARAACAVLGIALLGAAPGQQLRYGPVPRNAQTATVQRYVDALRNRKYDAAFALLADDERKYFGDAAGYRSVFDADGFALESAKIVGARGDDRGRVYFVRERVGFVDHANDKRTEIDATVPLGVLPEHGALHVKDPGKPYRAFASSSSAESAKLRVTVKKVGFFPGRVDVVVTFANLGDGFVTVLPYGKSVLRDDRGGVYRILATKDWSVTDKRLYQGVRLAPNSQYTGSLAFEAPRFGDLKRSWSLTVAPQLRDGADLPFDVTVLIAPQP
ncbi:MAG: hypothetical protein JO036_08000 [Candidatus Eremiobacteraeota bacterium]|nr:hypothetical protein [Candidatus Eremiobacteraeota bacterium]